jgi:hypothetical protein
VQTCGSVWACPVCSATIRQRRAQEIEAAALSTISAGGSAGFLTATLPHERDDLLTDSLGTGLKAWRKVQQNRSYREAVADLGLLGSIRATEVTYGSWHGWHPHNHLLMLSEKATTPDDWSQLRDVASSAWGSAVEGLGRKRPGEDVGLTLAPVRAERGTKTVAAYLAKVQDHYGDTSTIGKEMARSDLKKGRKRSRTPFELAEQAVAGVVPELPLWWEYERATKGRRAMEWSRGLKARFALDEVEDEDLVKAEVDGEQIACVTAGQYRLLVQRKDETHLLDLAEDGGGPAVHAFLSGLIRTDTGDE